MKRWMRGIGFVTLMVGMGGAAPRYGDHQDLMYWIDETGERHEVKNVQDWQKRREHVLENVKLVMGKMPAGEKTPLEMKVVEEAAVGELRRLKISYQTDAKTR